MKERIVSRNNQVILKTLAFSKKSGDYFLVEGFHMVEMALENGSVVSLFSTSPSCFSSSIPSYLVSEEVLSKLASAKTPEGVVALCKKKETPLSKKGPLLYLDRVQDPGNVGTLLRSALSFGFDEVLCSRGTASPYGQKALMASQGAIFKLRVALSAEASSFLDVQELKKQGYYLLSTDLEGADPLSSLDAKAVPSPFALVLGNEGQGVTKEINEIADKRLRIEMDGIDSLNVGVAGGILMYHLRKGSLV